MTDSSLNSLVMLVVVTYCCCLGLIIGTRLRLNDVDERLSEIERQIANQTNTIMVCEGKTE